MNNQKNYRINTAWLSTNRYPFSLFLVLCLVLVIVGGASIIQSPPTSPTNPSQLSTLTTIQQALVYGSSSSDTTQLYAYDIPTHKNYLLAQLPQHIKKIVPFGTNSFLFIDHVDNSDHGKEIIQYNFLTNTSTTLFAADSDYGIDDYVLSPNKKYLVVWEVKFQDRSTGLYGGRSKIYGIQLSNTDQKYLIYDELVEDPIHYPIGVTSSGTAFFDTFLPNTGAGWAYGMSKTDITGTEKQTISSMTNGTYSSVPLFSSDGASIAFTGYDGSRGDGTGMENGFRKALTNPNTVEVLSTTTQTRTKVTNLPNAVYSSLQWQFNNDTLFFKQFTESTQTSGFYYSSVGSRPSPPSKLTVGTDNLTTIVPLAKIGNIVLLENLSQGSDEFSNLGSTSPYQPLATGFSQYVTTTGQNIPVDIQVNPIQFITLTSTVNIPKTEVNQNQKTNTLQIGKIPFDPLLIPNRIKQQSKPEVCYTSINPSITLQPSNAQGSTQLDPNTTQTPGKNIHLNTFTPPTSSIQNPNTTPGPTEENCFVPPLPTPPTSSPSTTPAPQPTGYPLCEALEGSVCQGYKATPSNMKYDPVTGRPIYQCLAGGQVVAECAHTPLYIYGQPGTRVEITMNVPVHPITPGYENGYTVILQKDNTLKINSTFYPSIEYDFMPTRTIKPPSYGTLTSTSNLDKTLTWYASRLGLNAQEKKDLIVFGKTHMNSPYVMVSFFDDTTSKELLPLTFNPHPDTYINIIFYFKNFQTLPVDKLALPIFPKIPLRTGLTAVEIGSIVDNY